jgi:hypothetical protein
MESKVKLQGNAIIADAQRAARSPTSDALEAEPCRTEPHRCDTAPADGRPAIVSRILRSRNANTSSRIPKTNA